MDKEKKLFIVSIALLLAFGMLMPSYTSAAAEQIESRVQIEQEVKGTVVDNWGNEIVVKGDDGERYYVGLHTFTEEQIQAMNLLVGTSVQFEGEVLESSADFYDFAYFVKNLPFGVTEDEMIKLELLYNQAMAFEKNQLWEEARELWNQIYEVTNPYYLANWEPETFDVYISMFEYPFTSDDLLQMEELYNQWVTLAKSGAEEESNEKLNQFFKIVGTYYVAPTFDEYLGELVQMISEDDYPVIKQLYEDASTANFEEDNQLAMEKWEALERAMRPYYRAAYPMPTFEEQMSYYDFEVSDEDLSKLRELYAGILESEQNDNYEQVGSQWESFYTILEPYYIYEESIPFRASQVTVNGETFHQ